VGTVLYIVAMWISGVMQGLMWRAVNDDGTLTYSFVEALQASIPSTSCASWVAASCHRHAADGLQRLSHRHCAQGFSGTRRTASLI
jgi:hypothetical protein